MLNEEERNRIIEEITLREEIRRESSELPQKKSNLASFFNSAFFDTVIGGLVLASVGSFLQATSASNEPGVD